MDKYDGLYAFFEEEITEFREKEKDGWMQTGMQTGIYNTIYRNLQTKYGANSVSKRLNDKIDAINFYPGLEEIQIASWSTPRFFFNQRDFLRPPARLKPASFSLAFRRSSNANLVQNIA